MLEFFKRLFDSTEFMPHGHCYYWNPGIVWLHVLSDSLIALAYYSIPLTLVYFVRKRRDVPFPWMFLMFGAFIVACGTTHVMEIWTLWVPSYRFSGLIKVMTATLSIGTAILLVPLTPKALALPSPADLEAANRDLQKQILERKSADEQVRRLNREMEQRVIERTSELEAANSELKHEIAERKLAERALRESEERYRTLNQELEHRILARTAELESANRELEAFTYSVSHDLKAPLRQVNGFSKILLEDLGSRLDITLQQHLLRIQQGASQMGLLIDSLLKLSRLGRQELARQRTNLSDLVEEVLAELKTEIDGREIEWRIGALPLAECDPGLMRQVFANLLSNALKFTRPRPKAIIQVDQVQKDDDSVIFVRDNGVGFKMKYTARLFGVFQRLHRMEDFEGTGVGLAIVQRIIRKHGGDVWAEAHPEQGATFYFSLRARFNSLETAQATKGDTV